MKKLMMIFGLGICCTGAWADHAWNCHNVHTKEVCNGVSCQERLITESMVHIKLSDHANRNVSVCDRANCWNGRANKMGTTSNDIYQVKNLSWKIADQPKRDYTLTIDTRRSYLYLQSAQGDYLLQCRTI